MSMTVTATQGGSTSNSIALQVRVLLGAKVPAAQHGTTVGAQSSTPNLSITASGDGSVMYSAVLSSGLATTAESGETALSVSGFGGLFFTFYEATGVPNTESLLMGSSSGTGIAISNVEILNGGSGITIWSQQPTYSNANRTTVTTDTFAPPPGALLVAMVSSNGGVGTTTMAITDSMGLSWTCLQSEAGGGHGYVGIWVAQVPDPLPVLSYISDYCVRGNTTNAQLVNYLPTSSKSLIVCSGSLYSGDSSVQNITSITDSAGNTWHYANTASQLPPNAGQPYVGQHYVNFIGWTWQDKGTANSYSVNFNGSAYVNMDISEWSNVGSITSGAAVAGAAASSTLSGPTATVTTGSIGLAVINSVSGNITGSTITGTDGSPAQALPGEPVSGFIVITGNQTANPLLPSNSPYGFNWANFSVGADYVVVMIIMNPRGAPTGSMFKAVRLPGMP